MKQRDLKKEAGAVLLAVAMIAALFPAFNAKVHAAELPDNTQFAEKTDLMKFNTDDNDGTTNPAKVYFGQDESGQAQAWWITGSPNGNLTLFAASPLAIGQPFESDVSEKIYNDAWNCDYTSMGGSVPTEVYANHYGASPLRAELNKLVTSRFSTAEQGLMNHTAIYTEDPKNSSVYSTTDKLYLAYGNIDDQYIKVGQNSADSLNGGLRIDEKYWGNSDEFWLRAPNLLYGFLVSAAWPNSYVHSDSIVYQYALVPAFELNLTSVIFASAVPAASFEGKLTVDGNAMTIRYDGTDPDSAQVAYDYTKVNLTDVPSGTYLVVQNKDGAWAKAVSGTVSVSAKDMAIDSFGNYRVWLETTKADERKTYAVMATQEAGYTVNIADNSTVSITSGNATQRVKAGNEIAEITVKANSGYYLPDNYMTDLNAQLNGYGLAAIKIDTGLIISGTPISDVAITLPDAAEKTDGVVEIPATGTPPEPSIPADSKKDNANTGGRKDSDINRSDTYNALSPQTGDKTNISLYLLLLIMSGLVIAFCAGWKRMKAHGRRF